MKKLMDDFVPDIYAVVKQNCGKVSCLNVAVDEMSELFNRAKRKPAQSQK